MNIAGAAESQPARQYKNSICPVEGRFVRKVESVVIFLAINEVGVRKRWSYEGTDKDGTKCKAAGADHI